MPILFFLTARQKNIYPPPPKIPRKHPPGPSPSCTHPPGRPPPLLGFSMKSRPPPPPAPPSPPPSRKNKKISETSTQKGRVHPPFYIFCGWRLQGRWFRTRRLRIPTPVRGCEIGRDRASQSHSLFADGSFCCRGDQRQSCIQPVEGTTKRKWSFRWGPKS